MLCVLLYNLLVGGKNKLSARTGKESGKDNVTHTGVRTYLHKFIMYFIHSQSIKLANLLWVKRSFRTIRSKTNNCKISHFILENK